MARKTKKICDKHTPLSEKQAKALESKLGIDTSIFAETMSAQHTDEEMAEALGVDVATVKKAYEIIKHREKC